MTLKVMTVFGTRPEAIKMAPLVLGLEQMSCFESVVCVTAQHRNMLDQVLSVFEIEPQYDLDLMSIDQDLYDVTASVLLGMRDVLSEACPDIVLVHGDTTTCLAASLAAFYQNIPIGHVEAGLRTGDLQAPFPEEANRLLVDGLSHYHFVPTQRAKQCLLSENISESRVFVTGNTVIDALLYVRDKVITYPIVRWQQLFGLDLFERIMSARRFLILITGHRRENFGQGFINLCTAIKVLAQRHPNWDLVYPVHLNPNVQRPVRAMLSRLDNVFLIGPQEYEAFVWLMQRCDLIVTDSGGIQEEGPALGKPVLVTREVTERPEAVEAKTVMLVGTDSGKIINSVEQVLLDPAMYQSMSTAHNPYGDGQAAACILEVLQRMSHSSNALKQFSIQRPKFNINM